MSGVKFFLYTHTFDGSTDYVLGVLREGVPLIERPRDGPFELRQLIMEEVGWDYIGHIDINWGIPQREEGARFLGTPGNVRMGARRDISAALPPGVEINLE